MVMAWSSFIGSGSPAVGDLAGWETVEKEHKYLDISGGLAAMSNDKNLQDRMSIWEDVMNYQKSPSTASMKTSIKNEEL